MAAAGFAWTTLGPSRERRAWLHAAAGLSLALAVALACGLHAEPSVGRGLAVLAAVGAAVVAAGWSLRPVTRWALCVGPDGTVLGRISADAAEPGAPQRLRPQVVGARLVTLAAGRTVVAVWHDALPATHFRRLCAHARWHVEREQRAAGSSPASIATN